MKKKYLQIISFLILAIILLVSGNVKGQTLQANNDTLDLVPGIPVTINILANDIIPPSDTNIKIHFLSSGNGEVTYTVVSGGTTTFVASRWGYGGTVIYRYYLLNLSPSDTSSAKIIFRIHDHSYDSLYLNNINARFNACGLHFGGYDEDRARFEVPKFSGKTTIFSNSLWIGGLDNDSVLYLAAQRYGQGPATSSAWTKFDFWAGPVMDSSAYSIYTDTVWNYIWNLKKSEIEYHKLHWNDFGYAPIHDILTWPGNGNVSLGQAVKLAPFFDRNNDGIYNPHDGDYPLIRGDQALFFIFNDDEDLHAESGGNRMKAEIHGMAYAFDIPHDSAFYNTIFLNYKIFNRSNRTYYGTYIGLFTDLDIGWAQDDYIGCDVERSSYFGYNGKPVDGNGQPEAYGANPPAQSVTILGGPYLDPDGYDNPSFRGDGIKGPSFHGNCNIVGMNGTTIDMTYGINNQNSGEFRIRANAISGVNFGDGIIDNERSGMSRFVYHNNNLSGVPLYMQDPYYAPEYYNFLQGIWKDSTKMRYGGNGHTSAGGYGPPCNFMFPDLSDTCNWGTSGEEPSPKKWTEETAGNNPSDKRGVASSGPFTFLPGTVQELDACFIFARDYGNKDPQSSLAKLRRNIDVVKQSFVSNKLPDGTSFNGINDNGSSSSWTVRLYPNPASDFVKVKFDKSDKEPKKIRVINSSGSLVRVFEISPLTEPTVLNLSGLPEGLYLVNFQSRTQYITKKLSIIK